MDIRRLRVGLLFTVFCVTLLGSALILTSTAAWAQEDMIQAKYDEMGGASGFLGQPISGVNGTPDGIGAFQVFDGGSIYWSPDTGAYEVHGAIRARWGELGWEQGYLGYPISDELTTDDGQGRYSVFQGGIIYWYPDVGAYDLPNAATLDTSAPLEIKPLEGIAIPVPIGTLAVEEGILHLIEPPQVFEVLPGIIPGVSPGVSIGPDVVLRPVDTPAPPTPTRTPCPPQGPCYGSSQSPLTQGFTISKLDMVPCTQATQQKCAQLVNNPPLRTFAQGASICALWVETGRAEGPFSMIVTQAGNQLASTQVNGLGSNACRQSPISAASPGTYNTEMRTSKASKSAQWSITAPTPTPTPTRTATATPTRRPTRTPTPKPQGSTYYRASVAISCDNADGRVWFEGDVTTNGSPVNGVQVAFKSRLVPGTEPVTRPAVTGPDGYYSHIVDADAATAKAKHLQVWVMDNSGRRISDYADWDTDGRDGSCNKAVISFFAP